MEESSPALRCAGRRSEGRLRGGQPRKKERPTATTIVGIQGGPGSFNDSAIQHYLSRNPNLKWQVRHLDTTPAVFASLKAEEISYGQFAIYNSVGGFYEESLPELAKNRCTVVDSYSIRIAHALMAQPDVSFWEVDTIMSHVEVFKQCGRRLAAKFPHLKLVYGQGDLTDPARVAQALAAGRLPPSVAALSNPLLADIHGLRILAEEMQDESDSHSTFLLVSR